MSYLDNPSLQTYISNAKIPHNSFINRHLQVCPVSGSTVLNALSSEQPYTPVNHSRSTHFQRPAILGMDNTMFIRSNTLQNALANQIQEKPIPISVNQQKDYTRERVQYKKETLEQYDFCTELLDTTPPPYHIHCLQKEFIRFGGQKGGRLYPTEETMAFWNKCPLWMNVKGFLKRLSESTDSTNKEIQRKAILDFYGIILDPPQKKKEMDPGLELFWFTHSNTFSVPTTFLGRRIRTTIPFVNRPLVEKDGSPTKKDMISFIYFTDLKVKEDTAIYVSVTADDGFGTHLNGYISEYYNTKRVNRQHELISLTYMSPPTTFTSSGPWILSAKEPNYLTGYYHQGIGGLYYKLEITDEKKWMEIPKSMFRLTRDAFAPMISFEVEKYPSRYGCDYSFCDQRLGGYKMKWKSQPGGGPNWMYSVVPNEDFPFGKNGMIFYPGGGGILSNFSMKLYSFMTMTLLLKLEEIPNQPTEIMTFHSSFGDISIRILPDEALTATVLLTTSKNGYTLENPRIKVGAVSLIVVRMLRNEYDIYSLDSIQIGAYSLRGTQIHSESMKYSKPLVFKERTELENPNNPDAYTLYLGGKAKMIVYWMHFFDYLLNPQQMNKEAHAQW